MTELQNFHSSRKNGTDLIPALQIGRVENTVYIGSGSGPGAECDHRVILHLLDPEELEPPTEALQADLKRPG